jgi:hypothetical protein
MALHLMGAGSHGRERASDQRKRIISYVCFGGSTLSNVGAPPDNPSPSKVGPSPKPLRDPVGDGKLVAVGSRRQIGSQPPVAGERPDLSDGLHWRGGLRGVAVPVSRRVRVEGGL